MACEFLAGLPRACLGAIELCINALTQACNLRLKLRLAIRASLPFLSFQLIELDAGIVCRPAQTRQHTGCTPHRDPGGATKKSDQTAYRGAGNGLNRKITLHLLGGHPALDVVVGAVAARLAGSADLYQTTGHLPVNSVNFVTCHDGFTLNDR